MGELFGQGGAQGGGMLSMIMLFGGMFAIMYFILIRPQQKQQKKHLDLISSLKKGDEVVLSSGIVGRVFSVEEKYLVLEMLDKNKVKVLRHAVQALLGSETPNGK